MKQSRQKSQTEPDTYRQIIFYILRINEAEMRGNVPDLQALLKHGQLLLFWITNPVKLFFSFAFRIDAGISVMCELHCSYPYSDYIAVHEAVYRELLEAEN